MQLPVQAPDVPFSSLTILQSRDEYCPCHIYLPDSGDRVAAIRVNGAYYGFFRVEKTENQASKVCAKLSDRGYVPILTKISKGFAIWTLESGAQLVSTAPRTGSAPISTTKELPYKILVSDSQYKFCNVRLPDLNQQLMAIAFDGRYYSLFKTLDNVQQAVQTVKKLSQRGDETVITKNAKGYGLWVFEPDAYLD